MISIRDTVHVDAPASDVWRFLRDMEVHYREWHPEHLDWRNLQGIPGTEGGVIYADEWVGSSRLQARFFPVEVVPERLLRYTIGFPYSMIRAGGSFSIAPTGSAGCDFTAETHFGYSWPVLGPLLDRVLALAVPLVDLRRHMREEGECLARLVGRPRDAERITSSSTDRLR